MTSQQDTELEKILWNWHETYGNTLSKWKDYPKSKDLVLIPELIQALTSWKDKEVERALMGEIMGCPYHDDWRKHRAKLESLQSQGGKNE